MAPRLQLGGWRDANNVTYGSRSSAFNVYGDVPEIIGIQATQILQGRFLNHRDMANSTKVCVIGSKVERMLFDGTPALGEYIKIKGVYFRVVGIHHAQGQCRIRLGQDRRHIYLPFTTFQRAFNAANKVHWFSVTAKPGVEVAEVEKDIKLLMAEAPQGPSGGPLGLRQLEHAGNVHDDATDCSWASRRSAGSWASAHCSPG